MVVLRTMVSVLSNLFVIEMAAVAARLATLLTLFKSKLDKIYSPASPALIGGPRTYETVQFRVDKGRRMVARPACAHHPSPLSVSIPESPTSGPAAY
jgi:hypothetical protein